MWIKDNLVPLLKLGEESSIVVCSLLVDLSKQKSLLSSGPISIKLIDHGLHMLILHFRHGRTQVNI
jgi:hypothetical protein